MTCRASWGPNEARHVMKFLQAIVHGGKNLGKKLAICLSGVGGQIVSVICSKNKSDNGQGSVIEFRGALSDLGWHPIFKARFFISSGEVSSKTKWYWVLLAAVHLLSLPANHVQCKHSFLILISLPYFAACGHPSALCPKPSCWNSKLCRMSTTKITLLLIKVSSHLRIIILWTSDQYLHATNNILLSSPPNPSLTTFDTKKLLLVDEISIYQKNTIRSKVYWVIMKQKGLYEPNKTIFYSNMRYLRMICDLNHQEWIYLGQVLVNITWAKLLGERQ